MAFQFASRVETNGSYRRSGYKPIHRFANDSHVPAIAMDDSDWGLTDDDLDNEFGGPIIRRELEKRLVWKVDKRMSILVLIYVLNYVSQRLVTSLP